ncbi:hypothetical protein EDC18_10792 [Natranaerovirga pectinivora]|uniref:Uncharacterized protein n=1 Tax=Natranaerovirga pectinivora TaxID=682400 RepID=A0A4R3MJ30_9FIRM|nr:hypothetical protein [Natranaerovirga pectinivora]TCT14023.1 hypothetical protein EDC18_10792 [Natranaerovirga pectinivora]
MSIILPILNQSKYKIKDKYKNIVEIELGDFIDDEKSGCYYMHPEYKFIEFKYQPNYEVVKEDYKVIYGDMSVEENSISLFSNKSERFNDEKYRARVLIDKPITSNEFDIISIEFERSDVSTFFIGFFDSFTRDLDIEFLEGVQNLESYKSPKCDIIYNNFDKDVLKIIKRVGLKYLMDTLMTEKCLMKNIECTINISEGFIQLNNERRIYNKLLQRSQETYITYGYHPNVKSEVIGKINKVSMGKNKGYLFLKPIKIDFNKCKVLMLYSGKPEIEYLSKNELTWTKIDELSQIEVNKELILRVAMNHRDRIYSIFIVDELEDVQLE